MSVIAGSQWSSAPVFVGGTRFNQDNSVDRFRAQANRRGAHRALQTWTLSLSSSSPLSTTWIETLPLNRWSSSRVRSTDVARGREWRITRTPMRYLGHPMPLTRLWLRVTLTIPRRFSPPNTGRYRFSPSAWRGTTREPVPELSSRPRQQLFYLPLGVLPQFRITSSEGWASVAKTSIRKRWPSAAGE